MFPKQIILCRHAEKPADPDLSTCSVKGLARADYLATFFLTPNTVFQKPDVIYAFHKPKTGLENRSFQTMTPLIKQGYAQTQINTQYDDDKKHSLAMVKDVLTNNPGKTVLICWEHNVIPLIVHHIGLALTGRDIFRDMKSWNSNPESDTSDEDLFSLTLVINSVEGQLIAINQSNLYNPQERRFAIDPASYSNILYRLP